MTWMHCIRGTPSASHPSRVRGLKLEIYYIENAKSWVAPFTGAWIEMMVWLVMSKAKLMSHPSRVRGLKSGLVQTLIVSIDVSHPSRVRGLKCFLASSRAGSG